MELPKERAEIQSEIAVLDEYLGTYEVNPAFRLVVTREGSQLVTQATGQGKLLIFAEVKDFFYLNVISATISFTREDGKVTGLILKQNGRELKAKKH